MEPFDDAAERFMSRAIELSRQGMLAGDGGPFGAVVVRAGAIVGEGWNHVLAKNDPTAHAEMEAIRDASQQLKTYDLTGCEIYTSAEPCPMCLGAIYWSRIDRIFFGNSVADAAAAGFNDQNFYEQLSLPAESRRVPQIQLLREKGAMVFREFVADPNRVVY